MKFFVTGGSGYLGRNFIQYALTQNENVIINALSRSSVSDEMILRAAGEIEKGRERVKIIRGHINDESSLKEGLKDVNFVVHMAAKVQPYGYYHEQHYIINVQGTSLLLSLVESLPTPNKPRFVHISSFTARLSDHFPINSLPDWSPYSKSKCLTEKEILKSSLEDIIILRLGFLWGKDDNVLVPLLYNLSRNPIWKIVPPSYPLSINHITNACEAIYLSCITNTNTKRIYEIEDNEGKIEMDDFLEFYVASAYNVQPARPFKNFRAPRWLVWSLVTLAEYIPLLGYSKTWIFDGMNRESLLCLYRDYRLDSTKAKEEIGYVGKVSREQGIVELVNMAKKKSQSTS